MEWGAFKNQWHTLWSPGLCVGMATSQGANKGGRMCRGSVPSRGERERCQSLEDANSVDELYTFDLLFP